MILNPLTVTDILILICFLCDECLGFYTCLLRAEMQLQKRHSSKDLGKHVVKMTTPIAFHMFNPPWDV